ncbi:hypothetical protein KI387_015056, partial [Taxus chinensis]
CYAGTRPPPFLHVWDVPDALGTRGRGGNVSPTFPFLAGVGETPWGRLGTEENVPGTLGTARGRRG